MSPGPKWASVIVPPVGVLARRRGRGRSARRSRCRSRRPRGRSTCRGAERARHGDLGDPLAAPRARASRTRARGRAARRSPPAWPSRLEVSAGPAAVVRTTAGRDSGLACKRRFRRCAADTERAFVRPVDNVVKLAARSRGVVIAGPNLTIDRTARVAELRPGDVLRFDEVAVTPGGKGVNVARVARALGGRRGARRLRARPHGRRGRRHARRRARAPARRRGRRRAARHDRRARALRHVTVLNEPGPPLGPGDWERFEAAVAAELGGARVLACSGSLPPGAPADAYGRLVALARERGAAAIVDARRRPARARARRRPRRRDAEPGRGRRPAPRARRRDRRGRARRRGARPRGAPRRPRS